MNNYETTRKEKICEKITKLTELINYLRDYNLDPDYFIDYYKMIGPKVKHDVENIQELINEIMTDLNKYKIE